MRLTPTLLSTLLLSLWLCATPMAQGQEKEFEKVVRGTYVESFNSYFFVWPVLKQKSTSFSIQNTSGKLTYRPNVTWQAGAGVYIFGIGVQLVFSVPQNDASLKKYGKSDALDLQANIIGKNWGIDVFTQDYAGFYAQDKSRPIQPAQPAQQRKDVSTWNTGITGIYFFNKRQYSMRATYNYYERQLRSAGSFLLSGNINTFSLRADSAIYDQSYATIFSLADNFQRANYTTFGIAPGYAYNLVIHKLFFASVSAAYGPAIDWFRYDNGTNPWRSTLEFSYYYDFRAGIGYNSERFFTGITYSHQSRYITYSDVKFISVNDVLKFAIGYRFKEVGILTRRASDYLRAKGR